MLEKGANLINSGFKNDLIPKSISEIKNKFNESATISEATSNCKWDHGEIKRIGKSGLNLYESISNVRCDLGAGGKNKLTLHKEKPDVILGPGTYKIEHFKSYNQLPTISIYDKAVDNDDYWKKWNKTSNCHTNKYKQQ